MNTSALGTILGALALGGVVLLTLKVDKLGDKLDGLAGRSAEARDAALDDDRLVSRGRVRNVGAVTDPAEPVASSPAPESASPPARPATLEERIAKLESAAATRNEGDRAWRVPPAMARHQPVHGLDQLAKRLKLTPTQKTRVQAAVEQGKRRIEDLMKIPDAEGKSPYERRQERRKKLEEAVQSGNHGGLFAFATDMFAYRNREIPGRNTTYGQEMDRIKGETREEIAAALSPEQQKTFADTNIDPLVGAERGMQLSVFSSSGDGAAHRGVIVDTGLDVGVEEAEATEPAGADGKLPAEPDEDG